jgi:hypothetical protein
MELGINRLGFYSVASNLRSALRGRYPNYKPVHLRYALKKQEPVLNNITTALVGYRLVR